MRAAVDPALAWPRTTGRRTSQPQKRAKSGQKPVEKFRHIHPSAFRLHHRWPQKGMPPGAIRRSQVVAVSLLSTTTRRLLQAIVRDREEAGWRSAWLLGIHSACDASSLNSHLWGHKKESRRLQVTGGRPARNRTVRRSSVLASELVSTEVRLAAVSQRRHLVAVERWSTPLWTNLENSGGACRFQAFLAHLQQTVGRERT